MLMLTNLPSCRVLLLNHRKVLLLKVTAKFRMTVLFLALIGIKPHASRTSTHTVCLCAHILRAGE